jgi:hypothetical protein
MNRARCTLAPINYVYVLFEERRFLQSRQHVYHMICSTIGCPAIIFDIFKAPRVPVNRTLIEQVSLIGRERYLRLFRFDIRLDIVLKCSSMILIYCLESSEIDRMIVVEVVRGILNDQEVG